MSESATTHRCFLGMGGNLGHPIALFDEIIAQLQAHPRCAQVQESPRYESEPVDATGPNYINSVIELHWAGQPLELLELCMALEKELGRTRSTRNAPRTIDLDVLMVGDLILKHPKLTLPHPRMHTRRFVLQPLIDLWPEAILPKGERAKSLLVKCPDQRLERLVMRK